MSEIKNILQLKKVALFLCLLAPVFSPGELHCSSAGVLSLWPVKLGDSIGMECLSWMGGPGGGTLCRVFEHAL